MFIHSVVVFIMSIEYMSKDYFVKREVTFYSKIKNVK